MFKKSVHIASARELKQKTKQSRKERFVYMWDYNLQKMNETELLTLERNVAELDEDNETQDQLRGFLLRKIILTRRVLYLSFLKYKVERNEDIHMVQAQYHRQILVEEYILRRKKWWKKMFQFFKYLWNPRPLMLKDQTSKALYLHQEKIVESVRTNSLFSRKEYKFTDRISVSAEHEKLNKKYRSKNKSCQKNN